MNKMDFDSALRRQVMSLPELMRQQYADLEPKTRTVLSTPEIFNIQRIVLTGCGDSYAALLAVKPAFEKYAKIRTEVVPTIDLARDYEKKNLGYAPQSPLVIAVSNSGQVARVGEAVRRCRKAGAFTLSITGHEESVLGQSAERILKLDIPKFESAPGTRSYMVCVMALYLLAIRIGEVRGRYTMDVASARRKEIKALADALETALPAMDDTAFAVAQQWKDMDCYDFAGSGFEYACAFFGQAKVFEAIGRPAMYINTEEWLHLNFFVNHPEKIGTMIWAAEDNKADSRTLETIGYAKQLGRPLAIVTDREMPDETQAAVFVIPKAKNVLAESLYNFVPACLVFGYLMTMLGERSGRGCEGPWSFSKGAACVRQSEIVMVDD